MATKRKLSDSAGGARKQSRCKMPGAKSSSLPPETITRKDFQRLWVDLQDNVLTLLRSLFVGAWNFRYPDALWKDGPNCGNLALFGPAKFTAHFGRGQVVQKGDARNPKYRQMVVVDRVDLRFHASTGKDGDRPLQPGLWEGSQVEIAGSVMWVRGIKFDAAKNRSTVWLTENVPEDIGDIVDVVGRDRAFYDAQTATGTLHKVPETRQLVRRGVLGD